MKCFIYLETKVISVFFGSTRDPLAKHLRFHTLHYIFVVSTGNVIWSNGLRYMQPNWNGLFSYILKQLWEEVLCPGRHISWSKTIEIELCIMFRNFNLFVDNAATFNWTQKISKKTTTAKTAFQWTRSILLNQLVRTVYYNISWLQDIFWMNI